MKKIIPLIFSIFYLTFSNGQAVGGWGNCEFATVAAMNSFDPSTNAYDCKKVFVQATNEHYHWDGTQWVLDGDSENIYNTDGTLTADRTMTMDGNDLTFDGSTNDVFIESTGKVGIGTTTPSQDLDIPGSRKVQIGTFAGSGGGKLRVDIADGESDVQAIKTMVLQTSGNNYAVNGTAVGVGATTNTGLYGWADGATNNYGLHVDKGDGIFDDNVGIGTNSPDAKLDVENGTVRFSDYGAGTVTGTATQMLAVDTDGDIIEEDLTNASGTGAMDNIYTADGTIQADRTVDLDGKDLTFEGTNDVFIESTGNVGIGTNSPDEELEVVGDAEITQHLYVGPSAGTGTNTTMRLRENHNTDGHTYQFYSIPTITSPLLTGDRTSYGIYMRVLNNKTEDLVGGFDSDGVGGSFRTYSNGTNTFRNLYGVQGYAYSQSTATANLGNLYGGYFQAYNNAASGTIPSTFASYAYTRTVNGQGGDITNAYGSYNRVRVDSDDGGDITTGRAGYFLTDRRSGANLMTTAYGIQIDVNDAVTTYGLRVDADDTDPTTNYGIYIDAVNATTNNYGIFGERGDWVLDHDGNGTSGGTGSGGDLILGESQDLELYHDGTNSNIINNTGDLNITSSTSNDIHLSTNGGDVGIGTTSPDAKLDVENGTVRFSDYGAGTNTDTETYMLAVDTDGDVVEMNTVKSAKIFYPPAIAVTADAEGTDFTLDLHAQYVTLFGTPAAKSSSAPAAIPYYGETELYYYVTDFDTDVFENVSIGDDGVMEYDVKAVPSDNCSFINVVFVVK